MDFNNSRAPQHLDSLELHDHHQHDYNPPYTVDDVDPDFPPPPPAAMIGRRLARRIERACCTCATYFPLAFVYCTTTWAVWVDVQLGTTPSAYKNSAWIGPWCAGIGVVLCGLMLWSYTTAVFSSPGSTTNDQGYSTLPVSNPSAFSGLTAGAEHAGGTTAGSLTVKSNGEMRFCKKCQARKPDRAHHCSTCRRCVLKMDHHCPWLANCIGLRNGKAFVLFLIYTTLFSNFSFAMCGSWVWTEIVNDATYTTAGDSLMPIQYIMLCVIGGIIGLVVGLFTTWHIVLACRGQTTIESMEKTRYNSPLRGTTAFNAAATVAGAIGGGFSTSSANASDTEQGVPLPQYGRQLGHLNGNGRGSDGRIRDEEQALFDGIEGAHDDHDDDDNDGTYSNYASSTAASTATRGPHDQMGRRLTYNDLERYRAQKRHEAYLDQQDSEKLPHAFDLGVRRNLRHMFGPNPWLWAFPICTTTGDGWSWETGPKWTAARDRIQRERDAQRARERAAGWGDDSPMPSPPIVVTNAAPPRPRPPPMHLNPSSAAAANGRPPAATPSRYRRSPGGGGPSPLSPSKADRILGRDSSQYYSDSPAGTAGSVSNSSNSVSLQRLNTAGRAMHEVNLFEDDDDDDDDDDELDEEDELDNTSEEDATATKALPKLPPPQQSQSQSQRPLSPLRARWMPDPTSGLLRKTSSISTNSGGRLSPAQQSPTIPGAAPPTAAGTPPALEEVDGGVD